MSRTILNKKNIKYATNIRIHSGFSPTKSEECRVLGNSDDLKQDKPQESEQECGCKTKEEHLGKVGKYFREKLQQALSQQKQTLIRRVEGMRKDPEKHVKNFFYKRNCANYNQAIDDVVSLLKGESR